MENNKALLKKELVDYLKKYYVPNLGNISNKSFSDYIIGGKKATDFAGKKVASVAQLIEYYRPINPDTGKKITDTEVKQCTGVDVYTLKNKVPTFGIYNKESISKVAISFGLKLKEAKQLFSAARVMFSPKDDLFDSVFSFFIQNEKFYPSNPKENIEGFAYCLSEGQKFISSLGE